MEISNSPLVRRLGAHIEFSEHEFSVLKKMHLNPRHFPPGSNLFHEGQINHSAFFLIEGWAEAYKILPCGSRQIVNINVPGDFLGFRSVFAHAADYSVSSLTEMKVCEVSAKVLLNAFEETPRLAAAFLGSFSTDEAILVERLVSLGRRNAMERIAHFLLELGARLKLVRKATDEGYECPLSQYQLADILGLSSIHINRVLRSLREKGLLTFQDGKVTFDDYNQLVASVNFNTVYLG